MGLTVDIGNNLLVAIPLIASSATSIIAAIAALQAAKRTKELKPNGGSTMKDHVTDTNDKIEKVYRAVAANERATDSPKVREESET